MSYPKSGCILYFLVADHLYSLAATYWHANGIYQEF